MCSGVRACTGVGVGAGAGVGVGARAGVGVDVDVSDCVTGSVIIITVVRV